MADALLVSYRGRRSVAEDHEESLTLLMKLGLSRKDIGNAVSHLTQLLKLKNVSEYEERLLTERDCRAALKHLDRFRTWARTKLP